jgi:uncharacterized protein
MKRLSAWLLILLTACGAQEPKPGDGCVWKVSDADSCLYISGTIHLLRKEDHPLPAAYDLAYADSQRLMFELAPGKEKETELVKKMQEKGTLPAGEALSDKIPALAWDDLNRWCQKRGMAAVTFNSMRPWFVALLLTTTEFQLLGADPSRGVEPVFEKKAKADEKPTAGLETVDFQIGLFAELSEQDQQELLQQTLGEAETAGQEFVNMLEAWRKGDAEALYKLLSREADKYPSLMELFLHQRNAAWVKQLTHELTLPGNAMILVGAGHLGGELGLLEGLRKQGYKVERVTGAKAK